MRVLRAVIFDLDDTLYPERQYVLSGYRAVADWCHETFALDRRRVFEELVDLLDGGSKGQTFDLFLQNHEIDNGVTVQQMVDVYRNHEPDIEVYPGVRELLGRLGHTMRLGVLSDGHLSVQRRKFEALGISEYFTAVVFSDELGADAWKPSKKPFERAAQLLEVDPEDCAYVGENSLKDFLGAKRAGMTTVRVLGPSGFYTSMEPPTPAHAADISIDSLQDMEASLEKIGRR